MEKWEGLCNYFTFIVILGGVKGTLIVRINRT